MSPNRLRRFRSKRRRNRISHSLSGPLSTNAGFIALFLVGVAALWMFAQRRSAADRYQPHEWKDAREEGLL